MHYVSKHAKNRIQHRIGIHPKYSEDLAGRVLEFGIRYDNMSINLRKWARLKVKNYMDRDVIAYEGKIFIFKNNILITVLNLPYVYSINNINWRKVKL
jgi:hypothetical protein